MLCPSESMAVVRASPPFLNKLLSRSFAFGPSGAPPDESRPQPDPVLPLQGPGASAASMEAAPRRGFSRQGDGSGRSGPAVDGPTCVKGRRRSRVADLSL